MWHRQETRRPTENTNLVPKLKRIQTTRPKSPVGREFESKFFGGDMGDRSRCTGRCAEKRLQRSKSIARNMIFNRVIR
jgi:hypothetical protein